MGNVNPPFLKKTCTIKNYDLPAVKLAKEIIEKNLTDHWSLNMLASKAGINVFKLKIGFKQLYNESPYKFLVRLRLEEASRLLIDTDLPLKEIAYRTGFDSRDGFTRSFRKKYKQSPREWRKKQELNFYETNNSLPLWGFRPSLLSKSC